MQTDFDLRFMLYTVLLCRYDNSSRDLPPYHTNLVKDTIKPLINPFYSWYKGCSQVQVTHFQLYSPRKDEWTCEFLPLTGNLYALKTWGRKGSKKLPQKIHIYDNRKKTIVLVKGNRFEDLPLNYKALLFWNKWGNFILVLLVCLLLALLVW